MKHFLTSAVSLWVMTGCGLAETPGTNPADRQQILTHSIVYIGLAGDVPTALAAYNAGAAVDKDNLELNRAFVRRMADLGAPEAACLQAQKVEALAPDDGLALAVISYSQAAAGDVPAALANIVAAVNCEPTDPFILRTAGQLAAWLDQKPQDVKIPDYVQDAVNEMAANLAGKKDFADAFAEAKAAYAELAAAQTQAASQPQTAPGGDPAWGTIPLAGSTAARDIDEAEAPAGYVDPSGEIAAAPPPLPWGEFAPGVVLAPLQGTVSYGESYSPPPPVVYETVVNVYNAYDYYYPVVYDNDCNWYPSQVVFLGHFRRHGLLMARCRHKDVIVDHARNVYIGDARNVFIHNADNVVIDHARRVTVGEDHHLTASRTPRALLADNRGTILASRIERATDHRRGPDAGTFLNSETGPRAGIGPRTGTAPSGASVRDLRAGPNAGTAPRSGGPGPGTGTALNPRPTADTGIGPNPAADGRGPFQAGNRFPGARGLAGVPGVVGAPGPADTPGAAGATGAPGPAGRDRFNAGPRTRNPLLPDGAHETLAGGAGEPNVGPLAGPRPTNAPGPWRDRSNGTVRAIGSGIVPPPPPIQTSATDPRAGSTTPPEAARVRGVNPPSDSAAREDRPPRVPEAIAAPVAAAPKLPTAVPTPPPVASRPPHVVAATPIAPPPPAPVVAAPLPPVTAPRPVAAVPKLPTAVPTPPPVASRPPHVVAATPIAPPPPAPVAALQPKITSDHIVRQISRDDASAAQSDAPKFDAPKAAPSRVKAQAPVERPTFTPPPAPVQRPTITAPSVRAATPAPIERPTFTPPPPPVQRPTVTAPPPPPSPIQRPVVVAPPPPPRPPPPPPPARVEQPPTPQPRAVTPPDTRKDDKDSGGRSSPGGRR